MWSHAAPRRSAKGRGRGRSNKGRAPSPRSVPPPGGYRLVVLVGLPGSGKSTFASFVSDMGWQVVNQDTLGSRKRCENLAKELLRQGQRVVIDRCNFDQSQRVTWSNLAVSADLHPDACVVVWLDTAIEICQDRVQTRVGHPTLQAGPKSADIVSRVARDFRPPQRKEGFHDVLRCRGDHDLSEAVSLLSSTGGAPSYTPQGNPPAVYRASSAPLKLATATAGLRQQTNSWDHPLLAQASHPAAASSTAAAAAVAAATTPATTATVADRGGGEGGNDRGGFGSAMMSAASPTPGAAMARGSLAGVVIASSEEAPSTSGTKASAMGRSQALPVRFMAYPAANPTEPHGGEASRAQEAGGGRDFPSITRDSFDAPSPHIQTFPPLPKGLAGAHQSSFATASRSRSDGRNFPSPPAGSGAPGGPGGGVRARDATALRAAKQPSTIPKVRLLTPAEISANFAAYETPPRMLEPEDVLVLPSERVSKVRPVVAAAAAAGAGATPLTSGDWDPHKKPGVVPVGPDNLKEWTTPSRAKHPRGTEGGSSRPPLVTGKRRERSSESGPPSRYSTGESPLPIVGVRGTASEPSDLSATPQRGTGESTVCWTSDESIATVGDAGAALPSGLHASSPASGLQSEGSGTADHGSTAASAFPGREKGGLDLSDGEAFFVLEDMFGGLLALEVLERVFANSAHDLEAAVQQGFHACQEMWDREDSSTVSGSVTSETTTADALLAPGSSADFSGSSNNGNGFDVWDGMDDFADVSDWTHEQVDALTELCLAFDGTPRETVVAALISFDHDPSAAAQLLLGPAEEQSIWRTADEKNGRQPRGRSRRERKRPTQRAGLTAASLLGATCDKPRVRLEIGEGDEVEGEIAETGAENEGCQEEEVGDEGLTSEEYRARADEAAEEMKAWFQKAATAFTKGGRNGGAAAAHPSEVGQRWKSKMEAINLRAARETFRERNPSVRVGRSLDDRAVLRVLALPEPWQCSARGQLSVDLHLLRKTEAVSVLEAVLHAIRGRMVTGQQQRQQEEQRYSPPPAPTRVHARNTSQGMEAHAARGRENIVVDACGGDGVSSAGSVNSTPEVKTGGVPIEPFSSLEVVVGRGAHSVRGIARLRPTVLRYLVSKGFQVEAAGGEKREGVVVVSLR